MRGPVGGSLEHNGCVIVGVHDVYWRNLVQVFLWMISLCAVIFNSYFRCHLYLRICPLRSRLKGQLEVFKLTSKA